MDKKESMKILFISSTRIGDAILSKGILKYLLDTYPEADFTIVCGKLPAPLFHDFPRLDRLIVLAEQRSLKRWYDLWCACRGERWDVVVDLRGSLLSYALRAKKRYVWKKNSTRMHRIEQLALMMGLEHVPFPSIFIQQHRFEEAEKHYDFKSSPVIALAPAANWAGKEWPIERFIELVKCLKNSHPPFKTARIALFAAPSERQKLAPFFQHFDEKELIDCVGGSDLLVSAALLKHCALFIGNDSGLMHMAAAVGVPTFGLFGPSRDEHYAPKGPLTDYIRTPESYEVLMHRHQRGHQGSLMVSLSVQEVFERLRLFLNRLEFEKVV